jgi:hypothetical protein
VQKLQAANDCYGLLTIPYELGSVFGGRAVHFWAPRKAEFVSARTFARVFWWHNFWRHFSTGGLLLCKETAVGAKKVLRTLSLKSNYQAWHPASSRIN